MSKRPRRTKKAPNPFPRPGKGLKSFPGGKKIVGDYIGVDEVGNGALAGPLVVAAVAITQDAIAGVRDSKTIAEPRRYELAELIKSAALCWKIVLITPQYIDNHGHDEGWDKGTSEVIKEIRTECDWEIILDGSVLPSGGINLTAIPKADSHVYQVAAASIVAKAYRDTLMIQASQQYPQYGFEKHKGYGTKDHLNALKKFGPCDIHRKTLKIVKNPNRKSKKEELDFTKDKAEGLIDGLSDLDSNKFASDWEKGFVKDVSAIVQNGKKLSSRQMFFLNAVHRRRAKRR